jgi:hypothetical protein
LSDLFGDLLGGQGVGFASPDATFPLFVDDDDQASLHEGFGIVGYRIAIRFLVIHN